MGGNFGGPNQGGNFGGGPGQGGNFRMRGGWNGPRGGKRGGGQWRDENRYRKKRELLSWLLVSLLLIFKV